MIWYLVSILFGMCLGMTIADGPRFVAVISLLGIVVAACHGPIEAR